MSDPAPREQNRASEESSSAQLRLARREGDAFGRALQAMNEMDMHGRLQRVGDYLVGYAVEEAEGMYMPDGGELRWHAPTQENAHLEIVVRDADDGRFVPALRVHATLTDAQGRQVAAEELPFLWHPWLYHYGRNLQVSGDGEYSLLVRIDAPDFPRHDKQNGRRYADPVELRFNGVQIETGRKG